MIIIFSHFILMGPLEYVSWRLNAKMIDFLLFINVHLKINTRKMFAECMFFSVGSTSLFFRRKSGLASLLYDNYIDRERSWLLGLTVWERLQFISAFVMTLKCKWKYKRVRIQSSFAPLQFALWSRKLPFFDFVVSLLVQTLKDQ